MIFSDLRQALRTFRRNPWFTVVALATLALGIGVNSALFSVVKAVLLDSLPYGKPAELIRVWVTNPLQGFDHDVTSFPRFEDWKARSRTMAGFAGFTSSRMILTGNDQPLQLRGAQVTANFFRVMGVNPELGRDFADGDDQQGRPHVVMLSHGFWARAFGADETIVGRRLNLSGNEFTVAGVMPESFRFPERDLDYWTPMVLDANLRQSRGIFFMSVVARLHSGVTRAQAQSEMNAIARDLQAQYLVDRNLGVLLADLKDDLTGPIRPALLVLSGAVVIILLICCANIAGMLSALAADRERELSIRTALGANRKRIVAQLLAESVVLFLGGGVIGTGIAYGGLRLLVHIAPPELKQLQDARLDLTMVAFTLGVSAACGIIFGLRPAFHASRIETSEALKEGGRGLAGRIDARRFRTILTAGQIALAMVLLTAAGLLIRSLELMQGVQPGFDPKDVFIAPIQLPESKYAGDRRSADFYDRLLASLNGTAGVSGAGGISTFLLGPLPESNVFTIEGRPETIYTPLTVDTVSPEVFSVMKIPLLRGRFFDSRDRADSLPVAIVNDTAAKRYWPNADPIGQRFTFGKGGPDSTWYTIVGVVADTRRAGVDRPVFTESYLPMSQNPDRRMDILMRSTSGGAETRRVLAAAVQELDRDQPVSDFGTLANAAGRKTESRRFVVFLLSLFAGTAVAIGGVGIYGLLSCLVTQRRRELGVRIALGAQPRDVVVLILGQVMGFALIGLAAGAGGAWLASRALQSLLFGVGRLDPASYAAAAFGIILTCLAAAVVPAVLALRVDPLTALRHD